MVLNSSNSHVDKNSGAVLIHKSPELEEILSLKEEIKQLNIKVEKILSILENHEKEG